MNVCRINLPRILAYGALCVSAVACTRPESGGIQRVLIPWQDGAGSYTLQEIEVTTLENANEVRGSSADIFVDPSTKEDRISGPRPTAHFLKTDSGLIVPKDYFSSQFFGLYAHSEKLWEFDQIAGAADMLARPRQYGFGVRERAGVTSQNNAFYLRSMDATLILPFDGDGQPENNQLPMSLNAGILAHEHFHALFFSVINKLLPDRPSALLMLGCHNPAITGLHAEEKRSTVSTLNRVISKMTGGLLDGMKTEIGFLPRAAFEDQAKLEWNEFIVQALNEGLADVWGWLYSADANFIAHSVPSAQHLRSLSYSASGPAWTKASFSHLRRNPNLGFESNDIYEMGTYIARRIRMHAAQTGTSRNELAKSIVSQLRKLSGSLIQLKASSADGEIEVEPLVNLFLEGPNSVDVKTKEAAE